MTDGRRSAVVKAASLFQEQEARRLTRPLLTLSEKVELSVDLRGLTTPPDTRMGKARRGEAAISLVGTEESFEASAVEVLEQILRAVQMRGLSPMHVLHAAWAAFEQKPVDDVTGGEVPVVGAAYPPVEVVRDSAGFPLYVPEPETPMLGADGEMSDGGKL